MTRVLTVSKLNGEIITMMKLTNTKDLKEQLNSFLNQGYVCTIGRKVAK